MRYDDKLKRNLVKQYYNGESATDICFQNSIPRSTFYIWLKPYKTNYTKSGYEVSTAEFIKIKQHTEKLKQIIEVLKTVECTMTAPLKEKLYALEKLHGQYSVYVLCEALEVSRETYYNHVLRNKKKNNSYQERRNQLSLQIKEVFEESRQIFGAKKIKAVLADQGIRVSDRMVSELMQEMHLTSIRTGSKKIYSQRKGKEQKKDLLSLNFSVSAPNQVWVSDITSFIVNEKAYHICAILDLYSRKVISYKISERQSTQLITSTFKMAYSERKPTGKLIFHSARGCQYTANKLNLLLKSLEVEQSFSPKAKPQYNAVMESFFSTLKKDELYRNTYRSVGEFKDCIRKYMEFYNITRPHSTLQYKAPETYERTRAVWQGVKKACEASAYQRAVQGKGNLFAVWQNPLWRL